MTPGHKHRRVTVVRGSRIFRLLTVPTLAVSRNRGAVDRSRFVWGPVEPDPWIMAPQPEEFRLSPLGLLHGLFGLTLVVHEPKEDESG